MNVTQLPGGAPRASVFPLRFTEDPQSLTGFLRVLGMAPVVTSEKGGFADLIAGGGGHVMVHAASNSATAAPAGETQLSISVPAVEPAAELLRERGLELRVWDESYGKQGIAVGPHGEAVGLNEEQEDLYGYVGHDGSGADPRLSVTAVRASADGPQRDADVRFFAAFGFTPVGEGDQWWQELRTAGGGSIGLHAPMPGEAASRPSPEGFEPLALVRLGFSTTENLDRLADRLGRAGHPARVVAQDGVRSVHVTDPDGQHVEIHPRTGG